MQDGDWRKATEVLAQMRAASMRPDVKTYTSLIKTCTAADANDEAIRLFHTMEADGVVPDRQAYNSLMASFSKHGEWERVWSVHAAMRRANLAPDIVSYNTLIKACARCAPVRQPPPQHSIVPAALHFQA